MPARIIRPPCTRYQSECRLTVWRIASRIAWAAASSDMVMVRLHSTNEKRICRSDHLDKTDDDGREMVHVPIAAQLQLGAASRQRAKPLYRSHPVAICTACGAPIEDP